LEELLVRRLTASRLLVALALLGPASVFFLWLLSSVLPSHPVPPIGREVFGNIPPAGVVIFYFGVAAFVGVFYYLFALRARVWERSAAEPRRGRWKERLARFWDGVSMRTVAEDRAAGLMHSMIYWGFLVLFAGTVTLQIDEMMPAGWNFLVGPIYQGYSAVLDLFALVFLGGLAWAAARRYGKPPYKIRTKTKPEDAWTLGILFLIGASGLALEAARISLVGRPSFEVWSLVGYPLSYLVPGEVAAGTHQALWALHTLSFVALLVAIPATKLRHMFTSPANMFFAPHDRPKGAMKPMPNLLEAEGLESVGAAVPADFTWKQLLDTDACTVCGRCTSVCPAHLTGKALDPREIVLKLGEVAAASGTPQVSPPVGLVPEITIDSESVFERVRPEELWACTTCKACDEICPVSIEILDKILDMRRHLTLMEAEFPPELGKTFVSMENSSNVYGMSQQSRGDWTKDLDFPVKVLGDGETAEYLLWVGCAGSFDDRNRKVTVALARLLQAADVDFGILGPRELCTGDPARRAGNEYVFQGLAFQNIETLNDLGVEKVIAQCPHCFNTLRNEYPQYGGNYQVLHHSQVLMQLLRQGLLEVEAADGKRVTYHDPCYLGRHNDIYLAPREVSAALGRLVEMPRHGSGALCCGAGGSRMWMEEHVGKKVNVERSEEALATGAEGIATACPFCLIMLDDGVKELGKGEEVPVRDIAVMLAERLVTR
jgi:Fe-S oxidoreductase